MKAVDCLGIYECPTADLRDAAEDRSYAERLFWLVWSLKRNETWTDFVGNRRDPAAAIAAFADLSHPALATDRLLVPVPRSRLSSETVKEEWPGYRLAHALRARGAGYAVWDRGLFRNIGLESSSGESDRNSIPDHVRSLVATRITDPEKYKLTLVDDGSAEGTQIAGAAESLHRVGFGDIMAVVGALIAHDHEGPWRAAKRNVSFRVAWAPGDLRGTRQPPIP